MNTTTELPQHMAALESANRVRIEGAKQRNRLVGRPAGEVIAALLDPPPEMAALRLRILFRRTGLIPAFSVRKLALALTALRVANPHGRHWHDSLHLRDLTAAERRRLVGALVAHAPKWWREQDGEMAPHDPNNRKREAK